MGRIRTIKPEFFRDEELSALPADTHLFAAGLLCESDDEGYFNANPRLLKGSIFPLRESSVSIHDMLIQLAGIGYIALGKGADGKSYGRVVKFLVHQRVNRPSPSKYSELPISWGDSLNTHGVLSEDSLPEGKGKEGKGKEELTLLSIASTAPAVTPSDVVTTWNTTTADKLPAAKLTPKRQATIKTRLKEPGWLKDFRAACAFLANTPWYAGDNDRHWSANIDFALQAGKATELAEKATQPARIATAPKPDPLAGMTFVNGGVQ
jgi:hypothetical protein